jgi:DNA polymerase-3 subunit beta
MLKFSCEKAILVSAISAASRTVAQKSTIPALEGIYLCAGVTVRLSGYNLETGITVEIPADISEQGQCVMPAHLFSEIIRKLPDDIVYIAVDDDLKVSIKCGISSFTISAMSAADYPELPDVEEAKAITVTQKALKSMIGGTLFSVSENQARPIHTGCLFEVADDVITVVAVDGYRLALRRTFLDEGTGRELKFVAPSAALKEVERILTDSDEPAKFTKGTKHILFEIGGATLVCRLLEGEFLDWRRVVPRDNGIKLTGNVRQLQSSLERVSLIIDEKIKSPVHCTFSNNRADFKISNTIGRVNDSCPLAGDGNDLEIGFNCKYLLEALRAVPTEDVCLELNNGLSPVVMVPCEEKETYLYMVLPVRLKANEN